MSAIGKPKLHEVWNFAEIIVGFEWFKKNLVK